MKPSFTPEERKPDAYTEAILRLTSTTDAFAPLPSTLH